MSEPEVKERPKRVAWSINRERMVELAVVVFGVMIALGLENMVEEIRLRGDARELEKAFRTDIITAVQQSWERQVITPCLTQRLASLTQQAVAPTGAWQAAPAISTGNIAFALPQPYRAPTRVWTTDTFDRALGSEAFKRIPLERADAYSGLFSQIEQRSEDNAAEFYAVSSLAPLAFSEADVNAEIRSELLQNIALVDRYRGLALIQSDQIIEEALAIPGGADIRAFVLSHQSDFDESADFAEANYGRCIDRGATDRLMELARSQSR